MRRQAQDTTATRGEHDERSTGVRSKEIAREGGRSWALVFDEGDEARSELDGVAREHSLTAAHFTGLGAFRDVRLGYFDWRNKDYAIIVLEEPGSGR
jgi:uncharacterized protein